MIFGTRNGFGLLWCIEIDIRWVAPILIGCQVSPTESRDDALPFAAIQL